MILAPGRQMTGYLTRSWHRNRLEKLSNIRLNQRTGRGKRDGVTMLGVAAIKVIDMYQQHLSSRKGFVCAHHVLHHGPTCSGFAKIAIREHGLAQGLWLLIGRAKACGAAARQLDETHDDNDQKERPHRPDQSEWAKTCCLEGTLTSVTGCCFWGG